MALTPTLTLRRPRCTQPMRTDGHTEPKERADLAFRIALVAAVGLGFLIRAIFELSEDFPLNDGGLFYAMTREIQEAN